MIQESVKKNYFVETKQSKESTLFSSNKNESFLVIPKKIIFVEAKQSKESTLFFINKNESFLVIPKKYFCRSEAI